MLYFISKDGYLNEKINYEYIDNRAAKKNGILVGPGRGSAAGSLVAYSLNITELDPIENGLLFTRKPPKQFSEAIQC